MIKYLLLLLSVGTLFAASPPGLTIKKNLSEYGSTNHLQDVDLLATSPRPGTGFEVPTGMKYGDLRLQLHTNVLTFNHTNFFGLLNLKQINWIDDGTGQLITSTDHSNMVVNIIRHNDEPKSLGARFNHGIYYGSAGDPFGTTPYASFFSMQVSGGLGYYDSTAADSGYYFGVLPYSGDARITFVFHSDDFTWRFRELGLETGGTIGGVGHNIWEPSIYAGLNIISHNNIGDVWLGATGTRVISMVTPASMVNQNIMIVLDRYNTGLITNGFKAISGAYVSGATNFTIGASATTAAANFVQCLSNIFNIYGHGNRGVNLGAYVEDGTNVNLSCLSGTRDISITVGAGMTTTSGTNGLVMTHGNILANTYYGNGSGLTNLTLPTTSQSPTNIYGNGFNFGVMSAANLVTNYVINLTNSAYMSITNSLASVVNFVHVTNGPGICYIRLKSPDINYFCYFPTNWAWISTNGLGLTGTTYTNYVQVSAHRTGLLTIRSWGGNNPTDVTAKFEVSAP